MKKIVSFIIVLFLVDCGSNEQTEKAVYQLAERVLGKEKAQHFIFEIDSSIQGNDTFEISSQNGKILIKGNSNIALASGLHWYLKYQTNSHISWEVRELNIPEKLPVLQTPIYKKSPFEYAYYLNYCTFNYSMAFWDWKRWEKELDFMAMNGVNLALAMNGMEAVWQNTLQRLGFNSQEIEAFIPGPAFNSWWLMGNLSGWGGVVSQKYIQQQKNLQKKILSRMKELGIQPVVPGFYGVVPMAMKNKYPNADVREQGLWAGGFQRPAFLSPTDSLFNKVADIYYEELKKLYGSDIAYFSGDPFHEGGSTKNINLPLSGKHIVYGMRKSFPKSTWVFQGWQGNPNQKLISEINEKDLLILDMDCDNLPQWKYRNGWNQKPWIWAVINNYGGNVGLFGRMDIIANEPFEALRHKEFSKGLKGVGAVMEGVENNSVIYELLFETKWHHQKINLDKWISQYVKRRYGVENKNLYKAWQLLRNTVYGKKMGRAQYQQGTSESILCARPVMNIVRVSSWGTSKLYYNPTELLKAWTLFIDEVENFKNSKGFQYDLLDISRQVLANYAQILYQRIIIDYKKQDKKTFEKDIKAFLELLDDQDILLSSHQNFMLGKWLEDAKSRATNDAEKALFEHNARTQITTWSFQDSNLHEYAHREWSGLLSDFYKPRWELFFSYLQANLNGENPQKPDFYAFEKEWTKKTNLFPHKATQNPIQQSVRIYQKYYDKISQFYKGKE